MKIGKYDVKGRLGRGGMGVVYRAAMPVTGKIVALKVCQPADIMLDLLGPDGVRELFLAEAMAMADIRHPHVATVLDVGEAEVRVYDEDDEGELMTMPFFAMEYYCTDLGQVMGEGYAVERPSRLIPPDDALEYARQILEGLRRLHFSGLVHRDVKPFNVMLTDEDQVKLIDFGLSRKRGETQEKPTGMVVGSPYYTAPEQESDPDAADERADLFSVGVTLFRMITGVLPVAESGEPRTVMSVYEDMGNKLGWCPDEAWDVFLAKAMAAEPDDRFGTAREMLEALAGLAEHWDRSKTEACAWIEDETAGESTVSAPALSGKPRSEPMLIGEERGQKEFSLDELWRPLAHAQAGLSENAGIVCDCSTGLAWERGGSEYPLDYEQAKEYVENLRETRYHDLNGWRLPTVDELATLLAAPDDLAAMCVPPAFDPTQQRLWSADRQSEQTVWYVNARKGFVWWQDETCRFFVRAVCDVK